MAEGGAAIEAGGAAAGAGGAAGAGAVAVAAGTLAALLASLGISAMTFKSLWSSQQDGIDWMKKKHDIEVAKRNGITVPTAPVPSTINSPSASSTKSNSEWDDNSSPSAGTYTPTLTCDIPNSGLPAKTMIKTVTITVNNVTMQQTLCSAPSHGILCSSADYNIAYPIGQTAPYGVSACASPEQKFCSFQCDIAKGYKLVGGICTKSSLQEI